MKTIKDLRFASPLMILLGFCGSALGQGFINLNFEDATVTTYYYPGGEAYVATAPGWGPLFNFTDSSKDALSLNTVAMDGPALTLHRTDSPFISPLQGSYSLYLQAGSRFYHGREGISIGQSGQVPDAARSLVYYADGPLTIAFDGHALSPVALARRDNYVVYAANIAEYAGQTGQLTFTRPYTGGEWSSGTVLDNIFFSPVLIPEPSVGHFWATAWVFWAIALHRTRRVRRLAGPLGHRW